VRRPVPPQEEIKKPFAEAFKNIEREIVPKVPVPPRPASPSPVSLSTLAEKKMPAVARPATPPYKNGPQQNNTSALKSALANVLKEHKEKKVEAPTVEREEVEIKKKEEIQAEVKKEEPVVPKAQPTTESHQQKKPPVEVPQEPKINEVPEDVLTAILQGED